MTAVAEPSSPLRRPPAEILRGCKRGTRLEIKATVEPKTDGLHKFIHLEPDFAILEHPGTHGGEHEVVWRFFDVPKDYTPTIVPVRFDPRIGPDQQLHVYLKPFKDLVLDEMTITGKPYYSAAGTCWYEVVLMPRYGTREQQRRLYCLTSEMGGLDVEPPP